MANEWVLVDFFTTWCGPCKSMAPVFDAIAEEQGDDLFAAKVDVEKLSGIAASFNIRGLPTLGLPHNGKPVSWIVGAQPKSAIEKWIAE
jgi:thioredoxin